MKRPVSLSSALLAAFAVETLSSTWCLKLHSWIPVFSILYFLSGLAIAGLLLRLPELRVPALAKSPWRNPAIQRSAILIGLTALAIYSWCLYWFDDMPIDITNADMLPIIKVMAERFLAGRHSHVYDPIPTIWHGVQPIYLPAMWLPYVPSIALGIDMRWTAIAGVLFAFGAFIFLYKPSGSHGPISGSPGPVSRSHGPISGSQGSIPGSHASFFLGVLAFLLFWWIVADNTPGIVSVSEEGVVIGYYVFLVLALASGKPWLTGIAISLCMLSRYALVGWIPAYMLWLVLEKRTRQLSIISLTGILCFVLLFLIPVGGATVTRLAHLPGNYVSFAARVWKDSPDVFSTAPGLAWFFGRNGTTILHCLLIFFTFTLPMIFTIAATRKQTASRKQTATNEQPAPSRPKFANIPLAALKLSLVVFYCFIDVPYLYLFYTSSLVSLIILTLAIRRPAAGPAA
ncbi:MAG TPA: hypothetical protein VFE32_10090 [Puia sp.]|jgi:hypothetical protein|nr:hypothetical protein [Puia sp.]